MGTRLATFDYSRPYFYMVTLKKSDGLPAFSAVCGDEAAHYLAPNETTRLFTDIIMTFHETWHCIEPITCFSIMPDHIHLLIKIRPVEKRLTLPRIVWLLQRKLESAWLAERGMSAGGAADSNTLTNGRGAVGCSAGRQPHLFEREWHDWIIKKDGQLKAFTRYIRENPGRHWLRKSRREFFRRVAEIEFSGRRWYGYGNAAILDLPVLEPFRCSRRWTEDSREWIEAVARASRVGPGGAGVGTFMSPCEKACGNAIAEAGGRWIVLSPEGFGPRWHPGCRHEQYCADGRMLFLSLYPEMARRPTSAELYQRCHEMGDVIAAGLAARQTDSYRRDP